MWERSRSSFERLSVASCLLVLTVTSYSAFSLYQRSEYFGRIGLTHHQWLTGATLKYVGNWQHDGLWNDRLLMLESPYSIESQTFESRGTYVSYLPGPQLEVYALSLLVPGVPTIQVLHAFNLANHVAIAALIAFIVYRLANEADGVFREMFAAIAPCIYLLHPTPYYNQSLLFYADQGVMLPFAGVVALEAAIRTSTRARPGLQVCQFCVLLAATFIDFLGFSLAAVLFVFRVIRPLLSHGRRARAVVAARELVLSAAPLVAAVVLVLQAANAGQMEMLRYKFLFRTAISPAGAETVSDLWRQFFLDNLGRDETALMIRGLVVASALLVLRERPEAAVVSLIGFGACLLHTVLLRNHSIEHDFAPLKFFLPLSYVTFGVAPIAVIHAVKRLASHTMTLVTSSRERRFQPLNWRLEAFTTRFGRITLLDPPIVLALVISVNTVSYLRVKRSGDSTLPAVEPVTWRSRFPVMRLPHEEIILWLSAHARFEHVFVGKGFRIDAVPPQALAISRKRVYEFSDPDTLSQLFNSVDATFVAILPEADAGCLSGGRRQATIKAEGTDWSVIELQPPLSAAIGCLVVRQAYRPDVFPTPPIAPTAK